MNWTAGAMVFSGRPDPQWSLPRERVHELTALWRALAPAAQPSVPRAVLGYRGCWISDPHGARIVACEGIVVHEAHGGRAAEARVDDGRRFERAVLATAPPGVLPPGTTP